MEDVALHENLKALENLMTEFFRPDTSNQRKRSIEELLNNFSQQKDAWKHCLYFVRNSENEYVMMYGFSVVETIITKQWHGLPTDSKREVREILVNHLLQNHEKLHGFIVNKLAKLNVDIARHDWPHFYHDFLTDILQVSTAYFPLIVHLKSMVVLKNIHLFYAFHARVNKLGWLSQWYVMWHGKIKSKSKSFENVFLYVSGRAETNEYIAKQIDLTNVVISLLGFASASLVYVQYEISEPEICTSSQLA